MRLEFYLLSGLSHYGGAKEGSSSCPSLQVNHQYFKYHVMLSISLCSLCYLDWTFFRANIFIFSLALLLPFLYSDFIISSNRPISDSEQTFSFYNASMFLMKVDDEIKIYVLNLKLADTAKLRESAIGRTLIWSCAIGIHNETWVK